MAQLDSVDWLQWMRVLRQCRTQPDVRRLLAVTIAADVPRTVFGPRVSWQGVTCRWHDSRDGLQRLALVTECPRRISAFLSQWPSAWIPPMAVFAIRRRLARRSAWDAATLAAYCIAAQACTLLPGSARALVDADHSAVRRRAVDMLRRTASVAAAFCPRGVVINLRGVRFALTLETGLVVEGCSIVPAAPPWFDGPV